MHTTLVNTLFDNHISFPHFNSVKCKTKIISKLILIKTNEVGLFITDYQIKRYLN